MKKTILLLLLFSGFQTIAQVVNIPDANFKNALLNHNPVIDTNGDGEIQVSEAEAFYDQQLYVADKNISDLTGIEAFVNITVLFCNENNLTSLDLSQNSMLQGLDCSDNQIVTLDISQNTNLVYLTCRGNQLTSIDVGSNIYLKEVAVKNNQLSTLDLSQSPNLKMLTCGNNQLTFLDIRNGNNSNIDLFRAEDNPDLTCIFVNDATYMQSHWGNEIDPSSIFVETEAECNALGLANTSFQNVEVYPNPVKKTLFIKLSSNKSKSPQMEIMDLNGRIIVKDKLKKKQTQLDVSSLAKGVYFLKLYGTKSQTLTKKIIKL